MVLHVINLVVEFFVILLKFTYFTLRAPILWLLPKSKKDVSGEVVLITGGGMGMGRLLALEFAKLNSTVVIWDVNKDAMDGVVRDIKAMGRNKQVYSYVVDVSKREQVYDTADQVRREAGNVTILINNAGLVNGKGVLATPDDRVQLLMDVNTTSHFWTMKAFLPSMLENDHGHIVTVASSAGMFGVSGLVDYCASKFGALGLHNSLGMDLAKQGKHGVYTTVVCPYLVHTGMFEGAAGRFDWLVPPLTPEYAVERIMTSIQTNSKLLLMPRILFGVVVLQSILPTESMYILADYLGVMSFMDKFVGHANKRK